MLPVRLPHLDDGQWTECWVFFGMATRMAYQLYMHQESYQSRYPEKEQEQRRALWFALYEFDRYTCIVSKLPFSIQEQETLSYPIDGVSISTQSVNFPVIKEESSLIAQRIGLLKITSKINTMPMESRMELEPSLNDWYEKLPDSLKASSPASTGDLAFLHILYHYTRLLLIENSLQGPIIDPLIINQGLTASQHILFWLNVLMERDALFKVPAFLHHCVLKCGLNIIQLKKYQDVSETKCIFALERLSSVYKQAQLELHVLVSASSHS